MNVSMIFFADGAAVGLYAFLLISVLNAITFTLTPFDDLNKHSRVTLSDSGYLINVAILSVRGLITQKHTCN